MLLHKKVTVASLKRSLMRFHVYTDGNTCFVVTAVVSVVLLLLFAVRAVLLVYNVFYKGLVSGSSHIDEAACGN